MSTSLQAQELLVATKDWRKSACLPIIIDAKEFKAAKADPRWRAFCEMADMYVGSQGTTFNPKDSAG